MGDRLDDFLMRQKWLWRMTGGRPMFRGKRLFVDKVDGREVFCYMDRLGRTWMANRGFTLFRCERDS